MAGDQRELDLEDPRGDERGLGTLPERFTIESEADSPESGGPPHATP